jgi:hypothetical protein
MGAGEGGERLFIALPDDDLRALKENIRREADASANSILVGRGFSAVLLGPPPDLLMQVAWHNASGGLRKASPSSSSTYMFAPPA